MSQNLLKHLGSVTLGLIPIPRLNSLIFTNHIWPTEFGHDRNPLMNLAPGLKTPGIPSACSTPCLYSEGQGGGGGGFGNFFYSLLYIDFMVPFVKLPARA